MSKILKATHSGELNLNGFILSCSVLENGTRVFSERSLANAFGIKGSGAYWKKKKDQNSESAFLPEYLSANYLKPFIPNELQEKFNSAISYISKSRIISKGVEATILPEICDVYIQTQKSGISNKNLNKVAESAYLMIRGFAHVGIIALVDEVTGYQYDRNRDELQVILKAYISEELLKWQKRFPDSFYIEMFRLRGWDYDLKNIQKRPSVIGTWTNNLIYRQLPEGVLKELKKRTPKDEKGKRKYHYHRLLTEDIGHPHLSNQITAVVTLMRASANWRNFERLFTRAFGQQQINFKEFENE